MNEEILQRKKVGHIMLGFVIGFLSVLIPSNSLKDSSYRKGQLDYQQNKIEWILNEDGTIYHVEGKIEK
jgi:hypothetical protein